MQNFATERSPHVMQNVLIRSNLLRENIPNELKELKQWVCYQARPRNGKITKVPIDPSSGIAINIQDNKNWLSFEDALQYMCNMKNVSGIGFVFTETDPYVGIDIDNCIDENGEWNEVAQMVYEHLKNDGYVEYSPSGRGLHIIIKGRKQSNKSKNTDLGIEMYSQDRYFTVTGNAINQVDQIKNAAGLRIIEELYFTEKGELQMTNMTVMTEEQILERMFKSENGYEIQRLFDGDTSMYGGDESRADLALCNYLAFYTGKDAFLMDKLFRMSGLYRKKWDERHAADGRTYGQMTIEKAISGTVNVYDFNYHNEKKENRTPEIITAQNSQTDNELPWYVPTGNGGNKKFMPGVLAQHLAQSEDLIYSHGHFFQKRDGVYRKMEIEAVEKKIYENLLPQYSKANHIKDTLQQLKLLVYSEEDLYDVEQLKGKINFKNGIYDISTKTLIEHSTDFKTALQVNAIYNPEATCPQFQKFLNQVVDKQDQLILQELIGYLLTTETRAEKAFILYGPGRTGKSTFLKIVEYILGDEYVSNVPLQYLSQKFYIGRLYGKLLNTFADLPSKPLEDTGIFKAIVSGDRVLAEDKFKDPFFFRCTARLLFSCNELPPNYVDRSDGFFRRLIIIPFVNQIPSDQVDPHLFDKLTKEVDGIVQWALIGLHRLMENNFQFSHSNSSERLLQQYRKESNNVIWFVEEYCVLDLNATIRGKDLYQFYKNKCLENNKQPISKIKFFQSLEAEYRTITRYEDASRSVAYRGITIIRT
jgi:putative DNA primase/helicase